MAIGNASANPRKPAAPVPPRFWKGAPMWPPARKRMTIESRISPAASIEKKMKAQMVEITTPHRSKGVESTTAATAMSIQLSEGRSEFTHFSINGCRTVLLQGHTCGQERSWRFRTTLASQHEVPLAQNILP